MEERVKQKPYWYVDMKWFFGILLLSILSLTILAYNLIELTKNDNAIEITSTLMAITFSPNGIDDATDIKILRDHLNEYKDNNIELIPGIKAYLSKEDITNLSPREIRLKLFKQIAEPLYYQGSKGISIITDDKTMADTLNKTIGILSFITASLHNKLQLVFYTGIAMSLILLIPFLYFSFGISRIGNIGVILLNACGPMFIIFFALNKFMVVKNADGTDMISQLKLTILPSIVKIFLTTYMYLTIISIGIWILSILLKIIFKIIKRRTTMESH